MGLDEDGIGEGIDSREFGDDVLIAVQDVDAGRETGGGEQGNDFIPAGAPAAAGGFDGLEGL
jgi:hypothetical protein